MQILHAIDPPRYVFRSLIRILYRLYAHGCSAHNVFTLDVLQLQNCFVLAVQGRLIQLSYTEVFLLPVRLRHLQAGVHLSHCWHVVWHERFQLRFQIDLLRFVSLDILEQFLNLRSNLQIGIFDWVVGSRHVLIIVSVVLLVLPLIHSSSLAVLLLLLLLHLRGRLPRVLLGAANVIHINFVVFLLTLDFLTIIDVHGEIVRLVLQFFTLHLFLSCCSRWFLGTGFLLANVIIGVIFSIIDVLAVVELIVVVEVECFASLLGEVLCFILVVAIHFF